MLSKELVRMVYFALVLPLLMYGVSGWGGASAGLLRSVSVAQRMLIKVLLKKKVRHPTVELYREMDVLPVEELIKKITAIRVHRAVHSGEMCFMEGGITREQNSRFVEVPFRRTVKGQMLYDYRGAKIFNALPENIRSIGQLKTFKRELNKYHHSCLRGAAGN